MPSKFKMTLPIIPLDIKEVSIVIDDIDLTDKIQEVTIHSAAGKLTTVTIKFGAAVDLKGEAILNLLDHTGYPIRDRLSDEPLTEKDTEEET